MATPIPPNRARFSLADLVDATRGTIVRRGPNADVDAESIVSDSRKVTPGSIFVALRGEAHDGHAFLANAAQGGARILVIDHVAARALELPQDTSIVAVDDTLVAWGDLARAHLQRWRGAARDRAAKVIAITGSAGKTTTKELTAALLAEVGSTHYTAGNLNNRIGVPAVVFALEASHRFCVLEMGMSLPGELDAITSFAAPDVSVVVNVGVAHAEGVGGREGVMREKGAVYRSLGAEGIAIVNVDDEWGVRAAKTTPAQRWFGFGRSTAPHATAHYQLVDRIPDNVGSRVTVSCGGRGAERVVTVYLPIPGEAAAIDLAAALAVQEAASGAELSAEVIERALAKVDLGDRGAIRELANGTVLLDDTYNANPASMRSSLQTLAEVAKSRRRVAVLGEMKELGTLAEQEHLELGDAIADAGVALAIGCGGLMALALDRAASRGVEVIAAATTDEATQVATGRVLAGDAVLVKGSRSVGTEKVARALTEKSDGKR